MSLKAKSQEAVIKIANEYTKPWYRKGEYWVGIIANLIAVGALVVAIIAL
ncbi:MAG: hypothetical protein AABY22_11615 [Nanoarchaeota archaeon]